MHWVRCWRSTHGSRDSPATVCVRPAKKNPRTTGKSRGIHQFSRHYDVIQNVDVIYIRSLQTFDVGRKAARDLGVAVIRINQTGPRAETSTNVSYLHHGTSR